MAYLFSWFLLVAPEKSPIRIVKKLQMIWTTGAKRRHKYHPPCLPRIACVAGGISRASASAKRVRSRERVAKLRGSAKSRVADGISRANGFVLVAKPWSELFAGFTREGIWRLRRRSAHPLTQAMPCIPQGRKLVPRVFPWARETGDRDETGIIQYNELIYREWQMSFLWPC